MTSKSIKEQIIEKTLTTRFNLEGAFEDYKNKKIDFDGFMDVIEKSGDELTMAFDAYLKDNEIEDEGDPMAYEEWREREDEQEREAIINHLEERLDR